ncbi:MAG: hypothetical protein PHY47_01360 [Lachnospiraceae bacterium]|nr:hypothetical protein [Lachnospiraceae bacterium]
MAKDKYKKCQCNEIRRESADFTLTTHHPKCKFFDPGTEITSLEMQCKHFFNTITELKSKVRELKSKLKEVEEVCDSY